MRGTMRECSEKCVGETKMKAYNEMKRRIRRRRKKTLNVYQRMMVRSPILLFFSLQSVYFFFSFSFVSFALCQVLSFTLLLVFSFLLLFLFHRFGFLFTFSSLAFIVSVCVFFSVEFVDSLSDVESRGITI